MTAKEIPEIDKEDIHYYAVEGERFSFMLDPALHKYFHAGVPVEELARIRGCSVSRVKAIVKRQEGVYQMQAFYDRLHQQEQFDRTLAKLDPTGSSPMTMAYLQPLRAFLQSI